MINDQIPAPVYSRRTFVKLGSAGALMAVGLVSCGDKDDGGISEKPADAQAGAAGSPVTSFTIVARDMAWDLKRVFVPAGAEITATIENKDDGVLHNFHVKLPGDPRTELEAAPVTQTLKFSVGQPGESTFVCDLHPNMTGTIQAV